jgi:ketosteroid isomerase-like protein
VLAFDKWFFNDPEERLWATITGRYRIGSRSRFPTAVQRVEDGGDRQEDVMRALILVLALLAGIAADSARADWHDEIRATYDRFVAAQNARDLSRVRELLLDGLQFLWVSDGMSIWGREAMIERMASFQEAEVWRVEPDLARAVPVRVSDTTAFLHLSLTLVIGAQPSPDRLRFLVSILCLRTSEGWRVAALFTTAAKPG